MQSWTSQRVEKSCVFQKKEEKKCKTCQNKFEFICKIETTNDVRTVGKNMSVPLNLSTRKPKKVNRCAFNNNDIIFQVNFWEIYPPHFFPRCKRGERVSACSTCKEHGKQETLHSDHPVVDVTQRMNMFLSKCSYPMMTKPLRTGPLMPLIQQVLS